MSSALPSGATTPVAAPAAEYLLSEFAAGAARDTPSQVATLKQALGVLKASHSWDTDAVSARLADCLMSPRAYGAHAQLKACITAACSAPAVGDSLCRDLSSRLGAFLSSTTTLWPHLGGGALRSAGGAVPGWLELLIDVPEVRRVARNEAVRLLRLLTASLRATGGALVRDPPGSDGGGDASACAQEVCKVVGLMLRLWDEPWVQTRQLLASGHVRGGGEGCALLASFVPPAANDGAGSNSLVVAPLGAPPTPASPEEIEMIVELLRPLCADALRVATHAADLSTALASAHLLSSILDAFLPLADAAAALHAYVRAARSNGIASLAVALRGVVQGASTTTLCVPLTGVAACHDNGMMSSTLMYGAVGHAVLSLCAESVDASLKLFAFRALEALLVHMEADASADGRALSAGEMESQRTLYTSIVRLLFDNWEASFQSLIGMLLPMLRRVLKLLAAGSFALASPPSQQNHSGDGSSGGGGVPEWLLWLLPQLRQMDWTRRAKYRALQAAVGVLPRGACTLLDAWPGLLGEVFDSLSIPNYSSQCEVLITEIMRSLAEQLSGSWQPQHSAGGGKRDRAKRPRVGGEVVASTTAVTPEVRQIWTSLVLEPLLEAALTTSDAAQAEAILKATLPALLAAQPAALGWLLEPATRSNTDAGADAMPQQSTSAVPSQLRLSLAVLRAARSCGLLPIAALAPHAGLLRDGLLAADERVAHDALHVVCCHPKPTEAASPLEMSLLRTCLPLRMKGASIHFRKQIVTAMRRWLGRLKSSTFGSARDLRDLAELDKHEAAPPSAVTGLPTKLRPAAEKRDYVGRAASWLEWFAGMLCEQLYPGVPAVRSFLALDLYETFVDVWTAGVSSRAASEPSDSPAASLVCTAGFKPTVLFSSSFATRLVQLLLQDFDAVRSLAFGLLCRFPPGPLPGLGSSSEVHALLVAALPLLQSARVYESDAGAAILRLVAHRYVGALGWTVQLHWGVGAIDDGQSKGTRVDIVVQPPAGNDAATEERRVDAMRSLLDGIVGVISFGSGASNRSPEAQPGASAAGGHVHGFLTALRHAAVDMQQAEFGASAALSGWHTSLPAVLKMCAAVCEASMDVLGGGVDRVVDGGGGSVADSVFLDAAADDEPDAEHEATPSRATASGKLRVVLAWLLLKEATLCAGHAMALAIPRRQRGSTLSGAYALDRAQLDDSGRALVSVLLRSRHTGVIERAAQGLALACERLLLSPVVELASLPAEWLAELLATAFGTLDEPLLDGLRLSDTCRGRLTDGETSTSRSLTFLRRSAGLPHATIAILTAEPAGRSGGAYGGPIFIAVMRSLVQSAQADGPDRWLPRVHALNLLRMIFLNRAFVLQTMPHVGAGFLAALRALSAAEWNVRNSGMLLFAALNERALRQRRTREDSESGANADDANGIGVRDFFGRAPELLAFLSSSLSDADAGGTAAGLDPFPMLQLLSRLVASPSADAMSSLDDALDALVPHVRACGRSRALRVRQTAALALVPLVSPVRRPAMLATLAAELAQTVVHNHAHGILLQMRALVGHTAASGWTLDSACAAQLLLALERSLVRLSQPCNTVRAALAQLLGALAPLAPANSLQQVHALVQQVVAHDVAVAGTAAPSQRPHPDSASWRTELHRLHIQLCLLVGDTPGGEAALLRLLTDGAYELRLQCLLLARAALGLQDAPIDDGIPVVRKFALEVHQPHELSADSRERLADMLIAFATEGVEHSMAAARACSLHVLRLLGDMTLDPPRRARAQSAARAYLLRAGLHHAQARDPELRALALELAGEGGDAAESWTQEWGEELEAAAAEDMPVELRIAAARAIGASRPSSVRGWLLALSLLEDDDEEVREAMASALGPLVTPSKAGAAALAPTVVHQHGWKLLAAQHSADDIRAALKARCSPALAAAAKPPSREVFAVFPAEALNFYAETALEQQVIAYLLDGAADLPLGWSE